jgi:hypothetical protein
MLNDLLGAIDMAEKEYYESRKKMIQAKHDYLKSVGFTIEQMQSGFIGDFVYCRGDSVYVDVDHALEYAEDA